ncbi:hypothetical protein K3N28_18990 [Glycomyces sp. TRM65418]|uniref:hypothetical protein n=1 Tax=Glycomyces sp. TRM65418 TaxID=2867006 RepID=UPI001CE63753|nr:hypothetical protein [Glycomyces sp. TRM65418]MCC3765151.1 hypothetical protein [Glycomyces sp. TRM65418]QZD54778.1 hypothetical protein K3N28_18900 [Glycomyces sp. TRM65418]
MNSASNTIDRPGTAKSIVTWVAAPVAWFLALLCWLFVGQGTTAVLIALLALPAPWLLWTAWRMPRPRLDTYLAEGGALLSGAIALYITVLAYMIANDGPAPLEFMLIYLGAAAVFIAAAIPLPGRRIAYGSAALACVVIGIGLRVLSSETSYYPGIDWVTKDELFAWAFLGLPALGALLQILWWLRRRNRTA